MREGGRSGGAVVAAAVAMLEQQAGSSKQSAPSRRPVGPQPIPSKSGEEGNAHRSKKPAEVYHHPAGKVQVTDVDAVSGEEEEEEGEGDGEDGDTSTTSSSSQEYDHFKTSTAFWENLLASKKDELRRCNEALAKEEEKNAESNRSSLNSSDCQAKTDSSDDSSTSTTSDEESDSYVDGAAGRATQADGLETIAEEDRPVTSSSVRSTEDGEEADSSTCCSSDFRWISKSKSNPQFPKMEETGAKKSPQVAAPTPAAPPTGRPPRERTPRRVPSDKSAPGSLDRRRASGSHNSRLERDQKSKSTHGGLKSPSKQDDRPVGQYQSHSWCGCGHHPSEASLCYDNFHHRHERIDPQRYGSSSALMDQRGSHPDLFAEYRYRHDICCSYHTPLPPPACCRCSGGDMRTYRWASPMGKPDQEDRVRKLQSEKENLQLQVAVLNEQIDAQSDKIADLERMLTEKKQQLGNAEDMLQRVRAMATFVAAHLDVQKEMLSRSSLETQKLELMSAMSELKLQQAALERENVELRSSQFNSSNSGGVSLANKKPPLLPRMSPQFTHTSTPIHHGSNQMLPSNMSMSSSPVSSINMSSPRRIEISPVQDSQLPKTPPASYRRHVDLHYASLPRQQFISNGVAITAVDSNANPANGTRKGVAFGKGFSSVLGVRVMGHSVPNLAESEKSALGDHPMSNSFSPQASPLQLNKNKGLKKIFGRLKRSNSGNLEDLPGEGEFRRGGVRATAGPRLGWTEQTTIQRPEEPFEEWDTDALCDWLQDLGLECYLPEAKRWIKSGSQLLAASAHDLEKELGIKNSLHRKKLQLALLDAQDNHPVADCFLTTAGKLDTAWVLRWLDDTGLPQHKEAFLNSRVDGRLLHRLTTDDLHQLHVTSLLHVASLRRGIQVLRDNNFEPGCLQRRSLPDDPSQPTSKQVSLWTTHRVMEWLRAVDLAEYAPNLRGAGVHGGLMVLEPKFTAELLASLLSIPPSKTLLRRHLNTHFKDLLGKDIIQEKREAEATFGYVPLTPAAKLKVAKKAQFSLKRKKDKGDTDYGDLVCPIGNQSGEQNDSTSNVTTSTTSSTTITTTTRDSPGMTRVDMEEKAGAVFRPNESPALSRVSRSTSASPSLFHKNI